MYRNDEPTDKELEMDQNIHQVLEDFEREIKIFLDEFNNLKPDTDLRPCTRRECVVVLTDWTYNYQRLRALFHGKEEHTIAQVIILNPLAYCPDNFLYIIQRCSFKEE